MSYPRDYHLAEASKIVRKQDGAVHWRATCKCGWAGPVRDDKSAADDDALAHDVTEND